MRPITLALFLGIGCLNGLSFVQPDNSAPWADLRRDYAVVYQPNAYQRVALAEADVVEWEERLAWTERMAKRCCYSAQIPNVRAQLMKAKATLAKARRELHGLPRFSEQKDNSP